MENKEKAMALRDKFASSIASRTGISQAQAAAALCESVDLIRSRIPAKIGNALLALLDSANGIDPLNFLVADTAQAVAKLVDGIPEGPGKEEVKAVVKEALAEAESSPGIRAWLAGVLKKARSLVYPGGN